MLEVVETGQADHGLGLDGMVAPFGPPNRVEGSSVHDAYSTPLGQPEQRCHEASGARVAQIEGLIRLAEV